MSPVAVVGFLAGSIVVLGFVAAILRSKRFKAVLSAAFSIHEDSAITSALHNLAIIVEEQGKSIEWLRSELETARAELLDARRALASALALGEENVHLRARVAELEAEVATTREKIFSLGGSV
jgi:hypothetical protein